MCVKIEFFVCLLVLFINSCLLKYTMCTPQEHLIKSLRLALFPDNYIHSIRDVLSNTGPFFLSLVYNDQSTSVELKEVALVWLCSLALYGNEEVRMTARNALMHDCDQLIDADTDANFERLRDSICDRVMTHKNKVFLTMLKALGNVVFCMNDPHEVEESVFQLRGYFMLYDLPARFTADKSAKFLVTYAQSLLVMIGKNKEFVPHITYILGVLRDKKDMVERKLQMGLLQEIHYYYCDLTGVSQPHPEVARLQWCIEHVIACLN